MHMFEGVDTHLFANAPSIKLGLRFIFLNLIDRSCCVLTLLQEIYRQLIIDNRLIDLVSNVFETQTWELKVAIFLQFSL